LTTKDTIVSEIGKSGIKALPKKKPKVKLTTLDRANLIVEAHKKHLKDKEMTVISTIIDKKGTSYGVMALDKNTWSDVRLITDDKGKPNLLCDCKAKQFNIGLDDKGNCKHELSVMICNKEGIQMPTLEEILENEDGQN